MNAEERKRMVEAARQWWFARQDYTPAYEMNLIAPRMADFAAEQIEAQTKLYDALVVKYQNLLKWYDEHEGTPCEQIRHQHEIEEAVRPLYEALKHSGHAPSCNRLFWVGGHGVCDCGRDATLIVACEKWPGLEEK